MLRILVISIILVPIISYPYRSPYPMEQVGYGWPNVLPGGYNNYYHPQPYIVHLCNHTEWDCPKDPRRKRNHIPVQPAPGVQLKFCEYHEECEDIIDVPHKCCYDSKSNTRICKAAIKRKY